MAIPAPPLLPHLKAISIREIKEPTQNSLYYHDTTAQVSATTSALFVFPSLPKFHIYSSLFPFFCNSTLMERFETTSRDRDQCGNKVKEMWSHGIPSLSGGLLGGFSWPPRLYTCSFCHREFRSAQALGGHMNVHRRDRALLRHSSPWDPSFLANPRPDLNLIPPPNPNPNSVNFSPPSHAAASSKGCTYTFPSLFSPLKGFSSSSSSSASSTEALQGSRAVKALFRVGELKSFFDMDIEMYTTDIDEDLDLELRLGPS